MESEVGKQHIARRLELVGKLVEAQRSIVGAEILRSCVLNTAIRQTGWRSVGDRRVLFGGLFFGVVVAETIRIHIGFFADAIDAGLCASASS
jgi:hypothetical protein